LDVACVKNRIRAGPMSSVAVLSEKTKELWENQKEIFTAALSYILIKIIYT
jgi:hypothetical protein